MYIYSLLDCGWNLKSRIRERQPHSTVPRPSECGVLSLRELSPEMCSDRTCIEPVSTAAHFAPPCILNERPPALALALALVLVLVPASFRVGMDRGAPMCAMVEWRVCQSVGAAATNVSSKARPSPRATTCIGATRQLGQRWSCAVHASQQTQWPQRNRVALGAPMHTTHSLGESSVAAMPGRVLDASAISSS
jgi:hypothetical protein